MAADFTTTIPHGVGYLRVTRADGVTFLTFPAEDLNGELIEIELPLADRAVLRALADVLTIASAD